MGVTPARMVEKIRVEAVRRILEETDMPIKRIAAQCGFAQEERLRRAFARQVGTTPARIPRAILAATSERPERAGPSARRSGSKTR